MPKLKIIVIGPEQAGKSLISNIIADMSENDFSEYEPTEGVRILEVETPLRSHSGGDSNVEVELWDCAGSSKFQSCWPVIQLDTDGVIFVYNPQALDQLPELELLYDYFVTQSGLNDFNCLVLMNQRSDLNQSPVVLPNRFNGVSKKFINAANNPNGAKSEFLNYVETLLNGLKLENRRRT